jgi:glycosyltransferase involved in cell wall biosynthesis
MKVAAVIPAYNEEKTIANVVSVLQSSPCIDEIIVVSDGSTDNTAAIAAGLGACVVILPENQGKGGAMLAGVKQTDADFIMFVDADLIGLRQDHIESLLAPISNGEVAATLGVFKKGRVTTDLAQKIAPNLSGQRVIKTSLLDLVRDMDISRFGVELALNRLLEEHNVKWTTVELPELSHVMKEEKLGLWKGILARMKMYKEIITYYIKY